jgi:cbb3-type cytochrome oxidase subunit 3
VRTRKERLGKAGLIVMALFLIFYGIVAIVENRWTYENYWGGGVFAPVAILFGCLVIYVVVFRYDALKKSGVDKKGRRIRFPADDYRKW